MTEELDPFKIAQEELDSAAEVMNLNETAHAILREPKRIITVNIPVRMRDEPRSCSTVLGSFTTMRAGREREG